MKIIADENIAQVEIFSHYGELRLLPGREINAAALKDADALLVRSVTKVNKTLLANSSVKFVASATSGFDHLDLNYLEKENISYNHAPACNARSVVEYFFSAIAWLSQKNNFDWRKRSVGIIGAGNIGGLLAKILQKLDVEYLVYDPFLEKQIAKEHDFLKGKFSSWDNILKQNILTIHTPLTQTGDYPSHHLFNENVINALSSEQILINAARGAVVDNRALLKKLKSDSSISCVLDAWEGEPAINLELLQLVDLSTPHIAGYSLDGKIKGTEMILKSFCDFFKLEAKKLSFPENKFLFNEELNVVQAQPYSELNQQLLESYDIYQDHLRMQELVKHPKPNLMFDQLRKNYPVRLESNFGETFLA